MTAEKLKRLATEATAAARIAAKLEAMKPPTARNAAKDGVRRRDERIQLDRHMHEAHCLAVELGIAAAQQWRYVERRVPAGFGRDAIEAQRAPMPTRESIVAGLIDLADKMEKQGDALVYLGGFGPETQKGYEMRGAADIAREWAQALSFPPSNVEPT